MITTSATVSGLTAGTGYNVVLVAVSGDQSSNALHESFNTSKLYDDYVHNNRLFNQ